MKFSEEYEEALQSVKEDGGEVDDYITIPHYICKKDCGSSQFEVSVSYDATARVAGSVPGTLIFNENGEEDDTERDEYDFESYERNYEDVEIEDYRPDYEEDEIRCRECNSEVILCDGLSVMELKEELDIQVAKNL